MPGDTRSSCGIPAVVFGVGSIRTAHGKDEHMAVADLRKAATALIRFIDQWSGLEHVTEKKR